MEFPSIKKQTSWKVGFFDFGSAEAPNIRYFNPALIHRNGNDWLIPRKAVDVSWNKIGSNSLVAFKLDQNHKPFQYIAIDLSNRAYLDQNFEDARICDINGKLVLSYCTFQINRNNTFTGAHQQVAFIDDNWQPIGIWDPIYKGNGGSIMTNSDNEKNWIFFDYNGEMHCIYMTDPHEVVKWKNGSIIDIFETNGIKWDFGHIRGGSNAIKLGDKYVSFFHSSTSIANNSRRYHMGAYYFDSKPPFKPLKMTRSPILSGSEEDPKKDGYPMVVFPCGAIKSGNNFVVSFGVNECKSAWIEIPCNELDKLMKYV